MQLQIMGEWAEGVCQKITRMVQRAEFVNRLAEGDVEEMRTQLRRSWPFVTGFNQWIQQRAVNIPIPALQQIPRDEKSHSELWQRMAAHLDVDLTILEPDYSIRDSMLAMCDFFDNPDPSKFWPNCLGTEEFAVSLAYRLTHEPKFIAIMGDSADWMTEHTREHVPSHSDLFISATALSCPYGTSLKELEERVLAMPRKIIEIANMRGDSNGRYLQL